MPRKKKTPGETTLAAKYREEPKAIAEYLNQALSTGDTVLIVKAIGDMVRAQGVTRFSQKARMRRDNLYRSFSGEIKTPFETVLNVLIGLDVQLIVKPSAPHRIQAEK